MRIPFSDLFAVDPMGGFRPKTVVRVGPLTLSRDVVVRTDESELGLRLTAMQHHDLEVRRAQDGAVEIIGYNAQDRKDVLPPVMRNLAQRRETVGRAG